MGEFIMSICIGMFLGWIVTLWGCSYRLAYIKANAPIMTDKQFKEHLAESKEYCRKVNSLQVRYCDLYESLKSFKQYGRLTVTWQDTLNTLEF